MAVLVREATLTSIGLRLNASTGAAGRRITVRSSLNCQLMPVPASSTCRASPMLNGPFSSWLCKPATSALLNNRCKPA
ncbi:hypothetical protein D3C81_1424130 [compost metagenome]